MIILIIPVKSRVHLFRYFANWRNDVIAQQRTFQVVLIIKQTLTGHGRFGIFLWILIGEYMSYRTSSLLCMTIFCACHQAPPIDFCKEDVTIRILDGRVRVTGVYFFENLTDIGKRIKFYYPFPVDSNHHFPDSISLGYPFEKDSAGIYFWLPIGPNSIDSFSITYEQEIREPFFRYVTTTTKAWKRPIKEANFTIIAPETLAINANYVFSEPKKIDGNFFYLIPINNLFPEEDLIIRW